MNEDIIRNLWKEIESVSKEIGSGVSIEAKSLCLKNWLESFEKFSFTNDQNREKIKIKSNEIFKLLEKKNIFQDLINIVSKAKFPDTSPEAIDISIVTFSIVFLACCREINQEGLFSSQKEVSENIKPSPSNTPIGSPAQVVMNEIQCPDIRGTERDSSLPLQDYPPIKQRYILTVAISAKETDLINTLSNDKQLTSKTGENLFQVKQWIYYGSEEIWKKDCQNLFDEVMPDQAQDEYDVYYIKITMDKEDRRFGKESNMLKMYDAFKELSQSEPKIEISKRQPKESYENKRFYRV
ncbi:MAG: hypothetical protein DRH26_10205 [Deltaproteobacteria bacterium]|nr:MAG: hypothetical protein DRH26_10205 [Deltaproteobacteria bacterium]